jgi:hypothetical protein
MRSLPLCLAHLSPTPAWPPYLCSQLHKVTATVALCGNRYSIQAAALGRTAIAAAAAVGLALDGPAQVTQNTEVSDKLTAQVDQAHWVGPDLQ